MNTTRAALIVCATLVIGGLILTGSTKGLGNANEHTTLNDAWLTAKTKFALLTDARVMGREINVESAQGSVMIRVDVSSDETKKTVEGIANGINGVKSVQNDLQVVRPLQREVSKAHLTTTKLLDQTAPCQDQSN